MTADSFRDRLRRLRRDPVEVPKAGDAEPSAQVLAQSSAQVLAQPSAQPATQPNDHLTVQPSAPTSTGEPSELLSDNDGRTWYRTARYSLDYQHGDFGLGEISAAQPDDFALLTGDENLRALDLERAVYLDTETTGLSGGAGTYVFMIGLGTFERTVGGELVFDVWQGFLRGPEGEAELLRECAERLVARGGLVSFFGKSFDRHRLEDKMRLCDVSPPFEGRAHLDLYHPCRRLYRGAYEDGRLKTLERELCGLQRLDDLPGAFAPEAWFDYLAGRPHRLEGVFRHNLDDVLSLVTLAAHLGRSSLETRAAGTRLSGHEATRASGLGRSQLNAGDAPAALEWLARAVQRGAGDGRELKLLSAELLRKRGANEQALAQLRELIAEPEDHFSVRALIELSKLLEHAKKDAAGALEAARLAHYLAPRTLAGRSYAAVQRDLERRISRLEQRVAQTAARAK